MRLTILYWNTHILVLFDSWGNTSQLLGLHAERGYLMAHVCNDTKRCAERVNLSHFLYMTAFVAELCSLSEGSVGCDLIAWTQQWLGSGVSRTSCIKHSLLPSQQLTHIMIANYKDLRFIDYTVRVQHNEIRFMDRSLISRCWRLCQGNGSILSLKCKLQWYFHLLCFTC